MMLLLGFLWNDNNSGSACLTVCYYEKKEWLALLGKVEPPIRLKSIKNFSWKTIN